MFANTSVRKSVNLLREQSLKGVRNGISRSFSPWERPPAECDEVSFIDNVFFSDTVSGEFGQLLGLARGNRVRIPHRPAAVLADLLGGQSNPNL